MSENGRLCYKQHPEQRITTTPAGVRLPVKFNGEDIAGGCGLFRLQEGALRCGATSRDQSKVEAIVA